MMAYNIVDVAERTVRIRGNMTQRPLLGSLVPPNIQLAAQSLPLHHPDRDTMFKLHDTLLVTKIALGRLITAMLNDDSASTVDTILESLRNSDIGMRLQLNNNSTAGGEISESEGYR